MHRFQHHHRHRSLAAFSLVELSIVLVVLGLLAGGVLSGQALIRAAELRSLTRDSERYSTAVYMFRDKYFALPGDVTNATAFWGTLAGDGINATCQDTEATGKPTCNGDGDGFWGNAGGVNHAERFRGWQHLANAGLIEGSYTGRTDSATSGSFVTKAGKNVAATKVSGTHLRFVGIPATTGASDALLFPGISSGNYLEFRHDSDAATPNPPPPLTPEEAWSIDTKLDDGKPGLGKIFTHKFSSAAYPKCATTDDPATAVYNLSDNSKLCVYDIGF